MSEKKHIDITKRKTTGLPDLPWISKELPPNTIKT